MTLELQAPSEFYTKCNRNETKWRNRPRNLTEAPLASRQVAKIISGGGDDLSARCLTSPRPRPRLQPVIRIDLIAPPRPPSAENALRDRGRLYSHPLARRDATDVTWRKPWVAPWMSPIIMATLAMFTRLASLRGAHAKLLGLPRWHPSLVKCDDLVYGGGTMACLCSEWNEYIDKNNGDTPFTI